MLPRIKLQTFWIILLILSGLWVADVFGPLVYSEVSPTKDISAIVRALQGRGAPPGETGPLVRQILEQGGPLGKVIHVGHFVRGSAVLQGEDGSSHTGTIVSDTYLAWFGKFPKPILMNVKRLSQDGALQRYEIDSTTSLSSLAWAYLVPLVALAASIYLVRKRKSPLLSDPAL